MRVDPRVYVCRHCQGQVMVLTVHANSLQVECTSCCAVSQAFLDDASRCYVIRHEEFLRLAHSPIHEEIEPLEDWTLVDLAHARDQLRAAIEATDFDIARSSCRAALSALNRIATVGEPYLTFQERSC